MKNNKILLISIAILVLLLIILIVCLIIINKQNTEVDIENGETGNAEYSREQLKNVQTQIEGLSQEITSNIKDIDEFNTNLKEYIYLNGLVDATTAKVEEWNITDNKLEIKIHLNDINNTTIKAVVNLETNTSEVMEDDN